MDLLGQLKLSLPQGKIPLLYKIILILNHNISSRNQGSGRQENEQEKYIRLFVIVPEGMTEDDIRTEFENFGEVEDVSMLRDKVTKEPKGFAYVKYTKSVYARSLHLLDD